MFSNMRKHFDYIRLLGTIFLFMVVSLLYEVFLMCENNKETTLYNLELESNTITNEINSYIDKSVDMINAIDTELSVNNNIFVVMDNVNKQLGKLDNGIIVDNIIICDGRNCQYLVDQENVIIQGGELEWFNNAPNATENMPYVSDYKDEKLGEEYIVVSKRIVAGNRVVAICYKKSTINNIIKTIKRENAYILDKEGKVLVCKNKNEEGINLFKDNKVLLSNTSVIQNSKDITQQFRNGKDKYIVTVRNVEAGMKYVTYSLYNSIYVREYKIFYVNLIIIILIVIFVGLVFVKSFVYRKKLLSIYNDKCEFIKNLTKEIKVLIDGIKSKCTLISNDEDYESIIQNAYNINEDSNTIGFMLNCAYDYSQIAIGELTIDEVEYDMNAVKNHLKSFVKCDIKRKNIYFDVEDEVDPILRFIGDQKRLEEAIINMIKYSAEWTIQGGIDVKIKCRETGDGTADLIFVIHDTSSGMDEDGLIELEETLNSVNEGIKMDEVGIGIELSKRLVVLLNGKIKVETTKNIGNTFTIVVPQKISTNKNVIEKDEEKEENTVNSEKEQRLRECLDFDGFNIEEGLLKTKYDVNTYESAILDFYQLSHNNIREAVNLWNRKEFGEFIELIGKIKVSAVEIGAEKLYKMISDIEEHAQNKDLSYVIGNVKEFFDEWKKVMRNIALYFKG